MTGILGKGIHRRTFGKLVLATPLVLPAALPSSAWAADTWRFYIHQSAPQFSTSVVAKRFTEAVDRATDGRLKVRLNLAGTLQISAENITQAVSDNIVQMGDDMFFSGNVPIGGLFRLPFILQSEEDFRKASPVLMPYVERSYAEKGVTVLGSYVYPTAYVWGRREIASLADLKGAKVRVPSPEIGTLMQSFGAVPVSISAAEVPLALDRGIVDLVVTGVLGAALWKDLLRSGYLLPISAFNIYYIANTSALKRLPADLQQKLRETVAAAMDWNLETNRSDVEKGLAELRATNRIKITTPPKEEIAAAEAAVKPMWVAWAQQRGPEAQKALEEVRGVLGR